jgi:hypothetical protein
MEILLAVVVVAAIVAGPSAFFAWVLMLCLGALGFSIPFLPLWGIIFVAGCILGSARP